MPPLGVCGQSGERDYRQIRYADRQMGRDVSESIYKCIISPGFNKCDAIFNIYIAGARDP